VINGAIPAICVVTAGIELATFLEFTCRNPRFGWTAQAAPKSRLESPIVDNAEAVRANRIFHDHECAYYDERFAIVHDERSARRAPRSVEDLLSRPVRAGETVLYAGCGTGWLAAGLPRAVPGLSVIGVDVSQGMIEGARAAGAWPLLRADAQRLPLATASVDLIVTRGVLHHLPDVPAALTEWRRVLRPGGAVVVTCEPTPATKAHSEPLVRAQLGAAPDAHPRGRLLGGRLDGGQPTRVHPRTTGRDATARATARSPCPPATSAPHCC
jgi:SAM-dependent methyltransferase